MKKILFSLIMFLLGTIQMLALTESSLPGAGGTLYNAYVYKVTSNTTIDSRSYAGQNGLNVAGGATVTIYIARGVTLTCYGGNGYYSTAGGAGIYVPSNSTLIITGEGTLVCYGGYAGNGSNGSSGGNAWLNKKTEYGAGGDGGSGGAGGGGAGAGIGGRGGNGAGTNYGPSGTERNCNPSPFPHDGTNGNNTQAGSNGYTMGNVYAVGTVTIKAYAGAASTTAGSAGSSRGSTANDSGSGWSNNYGCGGGGRGAGGGAGYGASYGIGGGAAGAQSGAAGGSGGTYVRKGTKNGYPYLNGGDGYAGGVGNRTGGSHSTSYVKEGNYWGGHGGGQSGYYASAGGHGNFYAMTTVNKSYANRSASTITTAPSTLKCTATFNMNASDAGSNFTSSYYYGIAMGKAKVPTRAGYYFKGYYTAATGGTQIFDKDGNAKTTYGLSFFTASTTTLYAQYEEKIQTNSDGSQLKQTTPLTDKDVEYFLQHLPEDGSVKNKIDLSSATSIENPDKTVMNIRADKHFTNNTFIYVPAGTTFQNDELTTNVIFKSSNGTISCPNLRVFDGEDMVIPQTFTATNARYDRMGSHRWGTICVPFALESNATVQFYTSGVIKEVGGKDVLVLEKAAAIAAGQPAIYQIQDLSADPDATDDIYLGASNAPIVVNPAAAGESVIVLHGAFKSQNVESEGVYYYSNNTFYLKTPGESLKVPAFRAYIELPQAADAPRRLLVADADNPTAIYDIDLDADDTLDLVPSYDLSGRRIEGTHQGIIIKGGKKMIKK